MEDEIKTKPSAAAVDADSDEEDLEASKNRDSSIEVYARIRPTKRPSRHYEVSSERNGISFHIPKDDRLGYVNNQREDRRYKFSNVLEPDTTQDQVFAKVGRRALHRALKGFNATIFAYGQTGSGKTFTITGGAERYEDRGLIPRTISALFQEIEKRTDVKYSIRISYLEIYNNSGYDLLDPDHETKKLEDLRKVHLLEDDAGNIRLKNIGMLPVNTEEEALNLLFVGDTNRIICETPSNDASSRSHCVFTINIEARDVGGSTIRYSKLHLVDLAGSERVKKTDIGGKMLTEAVSINLALHYLESVIVALHEKAQGKRTHIPYRNSMMTSILKDSLGGNCKTIMIANMNIEDQHLDETISTCRFAQRVAMIRNTAVVNAEVDPHMVIHKLKLQVKELREEIALLKGESSVDDSPLNAEEEERCQQLVREFLASEERQAAIDVSNPKKLQRCFHILKGLVLSRTANGALHLDNEDGDVSKQARASDVDYQNEIRKLRLIVNSRDNEINILVGMLKQKGAAGTDTGPVVKTVDELRAAIQLSHKDKPQSLNERRDQPSPPARATNSGHRGEKPVSAENISDRTTAFEIFRKSYRKNQVIEENKVELREKYHLAKQYGEQVNRSRAAINALKSRVEQHRTERGLRSMVDHDALDGEDEEEARLLAEMDKEKNNYRQSFAALKSLKGEIETLQHMLESSRRRLQQDFDQWWGKSHGSAPRSSAPTRERVSQPDTAFRSRPQSRNPPGSTPAGQHPQHTHHQPAPYESNRPVSRSSSQTSRHDSRPSSRHASTVSGRQSEEAGTGSRSDRFVSTGNAKADADIAAFYKLRDQLMQKSQR